MTAKDLKGKAVPDSRWRLLVAHGNEDDPGRLEAGAVGTVREVVAAGTRGAHNSEEQSAVLEFDRSERGDAPQAIAFNAGQFAEWFEEA